VSRHARWGIVLGVTCWLLACIPAAMIVRELVEMWQALSARPSTSVRPVALWMLGLKWSAVNVLCGAPLVLVCATIAERLGSKLGSSVAVWSIVMCAAPLALAFFGPFYIVPATGSAFGT
jgi:hypothetical protein